MGALVKRQGRFQGWEYAETMSSGTNSWPIPIPPIDDFRSISVSLVVTTTGEGKIQFTTSSDSAVTAGTAIWQDWSAGSVTETTSDGLVSPVSGLRLVRTSGTVGIEILI